MSYLKHFSLLCLTFLFTLSVLAETYIPVDKGSKIEFKVGKGSGGVSSVKGSFGSLRGSIVFDPRHPEKSSFDVTVGAATVKTNDKTADFKVKSADYLDVVRCPEIRVKSTSVKQDVVGGVVFILNGNLTLKGVTLPVKIQFTTSTSPNGDGLVFRGLLRLNRVDFGVGPEDKSDQDVSVFLEILTKRK